MRKLLDHTGQRMVRINSTRAGCPANGHVRFGGRRRENRHRNDARRPVPDPTPHPGSASARTAVPDHHRQRRTRLHCLRLQRPSPNGATPSPTPTCCCHCRPAHLPRPHHPNRHQQLPTQNTKTRKESPGPSLGWGQVRPAQWRPNQLVILKPGARRKGCRDFGGFGLYRNFRISPLVPGYAMSQMAGMGTRSALHAVVHP